MSYALFDFDDTLIKGDSIVRLCLFAYRKGLCTLPQLIKSAVFALLYALHLVSAETSKQVANAFLAGKTAQEVQEIAQQFAETCLLPNLYPEGVQAIREHQKQGRQVWLVSASTAFYLQPVAVYLGLSGVVATRLHVTEDGMYSGLIDGHNCRGVEKTLRLAEVLAATDSRLDYASSYAYGDSAGDLPMLSLCAHKCAVNPRKKLLRGLAGVEGVEIYHWGNKHNG